MADSAQVQAAIAYYVRLLCYQYQLPKAQNTIAILVKQAQMDGLAVTLQDAFNVRTAVGPQLDTLGKYIGLPRTIGDPAPADFFGYVDYTGGGNPNGFTDYAGGINLTGLFYDYTYFGTRNTALSDTAYRFMLNMKIILNSSDSTLFSIQAFLLLLFGGTVTVVDNRDMTLTYTVSVNAPVSPTVLQPYLPKPMGVGINLEVLVDRITHDGDRRITFDNDIRVLSSL